MKILLISHGDFAAGLASTAKEFFGVTNVYSACVTKENGTSDLITSVEKYFEEWKDEQVVICSDLKGGSANQTAMQWINRPNTYLISGTNLSVVLQLMFVQDVTVEGLRDIINQARLDTVLINDEILTLSMDEDDE